MSTVQIDTTQAGTDTIDYAPAAAGTEHRNIYQPIRRPRKKPLFVVFCLMLAVSFSSASRYSASPVASLDGLSTLLDHRPTLCYG
jgi:hypothetical protein